VTVLAELAERRRDIDLDRAKAALDRAESRLAGKGDEDKLDDTRAQAALARAMRRITMAQMRL